MKKTTLSLAILLSFAALPGCQSQSNQNQASQTQGIMASDVNNESFSAYSNEFINALWTLSPTWALYSGKHLDDGLLEIPDDASRARTLDFVEQQQAQLAGFDRASLTANQGIDYLLIENLLESLKWEVLSFKSWQWDPSGYNISGGFAQIINEDFAPLDTRLASVLARMENVPAYYQAARDNIVDPTLEHTQLAILQNQGAFSVFSDELLAQVAESGLSEEDKKLFNTRFTRTVTALNRHIDWLKSLESQLADGDARSFRIGEKAYEEKFTLDIQSGMTAKALYEKAVADKNRVQSEMATITNKLWSKYFTEPKPADDKIAIGQMINKLSDKHVKREDFVDEIRAQIPQLIQFVNDKQLVTLDPSKPLIVRETPEYMRGYAGASISAPGPYEKSANTYYNVTPLDGMSDESARSYLGEYNHWILQILNIHEAIPGHYTQLVYSNQSPSLIKSLFGNGAMVEGWAVYAERMLLEEGYGDFEPEMWLMYYKWNLRVISNTILDYRIQVLGMTEQEAIDLMMNEAFQQRAEAEGKWRRATLSQVQLTSYYSGYREIYDFREEYKGRKGEDFDLKAFHEEFLSYGSAPVKYIRQLMLARL